MEKLKLKSIAGPLRVDHLTQSLTHFAQHFSQSLTVLVSNYYNSEMPNTEHPKTKPCRNLNGREFGFQTQIWSFQTERKRAMGFS